MSKCVAASVVLLPLLAACGETTSTCRRLGSDVLMEVRESSRADNVGDCQVPPAFRLAALGCNTNESYSADLCDISYDLLCVGDASMEIEVKQETEDGIIGTLHKVDNRKGCSLDLEITVKTTPAPTVDAGK
jgi:hypothetical protein